MTITQLQLHTLRLLRKEAALRVYRSNHAHDYTWVHKDAQAPITPLQGPTAGQPFYVPEETVKIGFSGVMIDSANKVESTGKVDSASKQAEKILQDAARIALTLQDNPHMRLKGFKLKAAISPDLELEFEMKGGTEPMAASTPNR